MKVFYSAILNIIVLQGPDGVEWLSMEDLWRAHQMWGTGAASIYDTNFEYIGEL